MARIVGMATCLNEEQESLKLRLTEIGFVPGESVWIVAESFPGRDPIAVRIGNSTFALRGYEAALIEVEIDG